MTRRIEGWITLSFLLFVVSVSLSLFYVSAPGAGAFDLPVMIFSYLTAGLFFLYLALKYLGKLDELAPSWTDRTALIGGVITSIFLILQII